jgi:hypothetical protein
VSERDRNRAIAASARYTRGMAAARWSPSLVALIAANAVPFLGALFFGWSAGAILGLYWAESAVVGFYTALKLLTCRAEGPVAAPRWFLVPFFAVHFGIFMLVHGAFVLIVAAATASGGFLGASVELRPDAVARSVLDLAGSAAVALVALLASHGVSFATNWIGRGEYRRLPAPQVMMQPYARIVVMHLTLMVGFTLAVFVGTSPPVVAVLVVLKTAADARQHLREHAALQPPAPEPAAADSAAAEPARRRGRAAGR